MLAEQIRRLINNGRLRQLEDGPVGGTPLYLGEDQIAQVVQAPLPNQGGWNLSRISDLSLAQSAFQLVSCSRVWLPTMQKSAIQNLPISTVGAIGEIGPLHLDVEYDARAGTIRGPFHIFETTPNSVPTYPVLWSHQAERERTISFDADCEGIPHQGRDLREEELVTRKLEKVWSTSSHCHFNENFQFNSQSTAMQFTPRRSIGGRAWKSIQLANEEQEKALVLWANTSFGLLLHWWHANKQQAGRGNIGKAALHALPVLDVGSLDHEQLVNAVRIFDEMSKKELRPLHEIDFDPVRAELDTRFGRDVLGLDEAIVKKGGPLELLRMKLSKEPSIRGTK
jgi:hypothetical protein